MQFLTMSSSVRRAACRSFCLLSLFSLVSQFVQSEENSATVDVVDSTSPEVVKWIEASKMSGRLEVEFYPPNKRPKPFDGWTDFNLTMEYKYDHSIKWKGVKGQTLDVSIVPAFTSVKPLISHIIKLPESIDHDQWYTSVLGRHELDHVAIGSHPRLMMLASHLVKNLGRLTRTADRVTDVTQKWAQEEINQAVDVRTRSLHALVVSNNERLDALTRHGARKLAERGEFFDRLFLKENLDESKFSFLGESMKLLDSKEYQEATLQFPH